MNNLIEIVDCLTEEQCDFVLSKINVEVFRASTIFAGSDVKSLSENLHIRNSTSTFLLDSSEETQLLHNKINDSLLVYKEKVAKINNIFNYYPIPGGVGVKCYREAIQILRYQQGQKYEFHHDIADHGNAREHYRTISVVVYLNDAFRGGGTEFPHRVFKPMKGQALLFPACWTHPHKAQEVTEGEKFVAVTWYYSSPLS